MLTPHQDEAITAYFIFMEAHPECFAPRARRHIVCDRRILESYASEHGVVLGLAAQTPYVVFLVDLVEPCTADGSPICTADGSPIRAFYLRLLDLKQLGGAVNTAVLGTIANPTLGRLGDVVLVRQERHATGLWHLELPRGGGEVHLSGEQNALKELREETGYLGEQAIRLGTTYTDTGVTDACVTFYYVPIIGQREATPESEEAIQDVQLLAVADMWAKIRQGEVTDSFTIQGLALFEQYRNSVGTD